MTLVAFALIAAAVAVALRTSRDAAVRSAVRANLSR